MGESAAASVKEDCSAAEATMAFLRRHIALISRDQNLNDRLHGLAAPGKSWIRIIDPDGTIRYEPSLEMLTLMAEVHLYLKQQAALPPLEWWMKHKEGR